MVGPIGNTPYMPPLPPKQDNIDINQCIKLFQNAIYSINHNNLPQAEDDLNQIIHELNGYIGRDGRIYVALGCAREALNDLKSKSPNLTDAVNQCNNAIQTLEMPPP